MKSIKKTSWLLLMLALPCLAAADSEPHFELAHISFFSNTGSGGNLANEPGLRLNFGSEHRASRLGWEYNMGSGSGHRYQGLYGFYNLHGKKDWHHQLWFMAGVADVYLTQARLRQTGPSYGLRYRRCEPYICGVVEYLVNDINAPQLRSQNFGLGFELYVF